CLERLVDQLEGNRPNQQAGAERHHDRDQPPTRCEQVGDERADGQRGGTKGSPAECLRHLITPPWSSRRGALVVFAHRPTGAATLAAGTPIVNDGPGGSRPGPPVPPCGRRP